MNQGSLTIKQKNKKRAFTLVELIVSISIFAFMTALVVAKYGNFNQSVLLTNLAYDVALTIRTAQTYGVSVRQESGNFNYPYGVYFSADPSENTKFTFFVDRDPSSLNYYSSGEEINVYSLKRGAKIKYICTETTCNSSYNEDQLHVTFKRPNPDAIICTPGNSCGSLGYVKIIIEGTDGGIRSVVVRSNGQISVEED